MKKYDAKKWNISICGLNCSECDIYKAGRGDKKLLDEIVEWFLKERNEKIKPEQVKCDGCRGSSDAHWSSDCKIMLCAKKKNLQYCFQCEGFPCKILDEFSSDGVAHHKRTVENMKKMKEIGLDEWIAEQERKGQFTFCS